MNMGTRHTYQYILHSYRCVSSSLSIVFIFQKINNPKYFLFQIFSIYHQFPQKIKSSDSFEKLRSWGFQNCPYFWFLTNSDWTHQGKKKNWTFLKFHPLYVSSITNQQEILITVKLKPNVIKQKRKVHCTLTIVHILVTLFWKLWWLWSDS